MSQPTINIVLDRIPEPPGPWSLVSTAARVVGRTPATLRRWRREGHVTPSVILYQHGSGGSLRLPLYTIEDMDRAIVYAESVRPGPRPGTGGRPPRQARHKLTVAS